MASVQNKGGASNKHVFIARDEMVAIVEKVQNAIDIMIESASPEDECLAFGAARDLTYVRRQLDAALVEDEEQRMARLQNGDGKAAE